MKIRLKLNARKIVEKNEKLREKKYVEGRKTFHVVNEIKREK